MSTNRNYSSPRWDYLHTFRTFVPASEQVLARHQNREVPFLESKLEVLNRHLLDTNHQLRTRLDELDVLRKKYEELQRENVELMARERRVDRRCGRLVQENDLLRGLRGDRRG